jgi:hypothetical protein
MTAPDDPDRDRQAALPAAGTGKPDIARVYGYRLGGKGHYAALARNRTDENRDHQRGGVRHHD